MSKNGKWIRISELIKKVRQMGYKKMARVTKRKK